MVVKSNDVIQNHISVESYSIRVLVDMLSIGYPQEGFSLEQKKIYVDEHRH